MGYYIDPPDCTKEEFLKRHGTPIERGQTINWKGDALPVCLVYNPMFTAAGICYDQREYRVFNQPEDYRKKEWYMVPREALKPYYSKA